MAESVKMWAILSPEGVLQWGSFSGSEETSFENLADLSEMSAEMLREEGLKAVRVTVTIEEEKD